MSSHVALKFEVWFPEASWEARSTQACGGYHAALLSAGNVPEC